MNVQALHAALGDGPWSEAELTAEIQRVARIPAWDGATVSAAKAMVANAGGLGWADGLFVKKELPAELTWREAQERTREADRREQERVLAEQDRQTQEQFEYSPPTRAWVKAYIDTRLNELGLIGVTHNE